MPILLLPRRFGGEGGEGAAEHLLLRGVAAPFRPTVRTPLQSVRALLQTVRLPLQSVRALLDLPVAVGRTKSGRMRRSQPKFNARLGKSLVIVSCVILLLGSAVYAGPAWRFEPRRLGAALLEGGWTVQRSLDVANGCPEFTFPIELIYLSNHTQRSGFGDEWFSPQLESNVLPKGKGVLAWTMPSGGVSGLFADERRASYFSDPSGE